MSRPDKILHAVAGPDPLGEYTVGELCPPADYHDTLKVSHLARGTITAGHVVGGLEDCLDVNNHSASLDITASLWEPRGQYLATIKGGSRDITLRGIVRGHGQTVDVDLGNISDQSDDPTTGVKLDLQHELGEPITVRVLNADMPLLLNSSTQRYLIRRPLRALLAKYWAKAYALLKRIGLPI